MDRQYVGIDLLRRRSVIVRVDGDGTKLGSVRVPNDPSEISVGSLSPSAGPVAGLSCRQVRPGPNLTLATAG
jgi:hypothetical protein